MIVKNSPIDIEGIYEDYINSKQEDNRLERYEGNESWYHGSGAGSCSRKLYFESVEQVEPTNPIDSNTKRLLRLGNVVHGRNKQLNPSIHYELQLGTYGYAIKEKFGQLDGMFLYYYNKDNSQMRAVEVPLTFVSRAYLYWRNLNDEHKMGLPNFKVGVSPVQSWQCNYCQFKNHCNP